MSISLPFLVSETNYTLTTSIDDDAYEFDIRWNSRDAAWYMDMYEADRTPVIINAKILLGVPIGRYSQHRFFADHKLIVVDSEGSGIDARFDDLNARILVVVNSPNDFF